MNNTLHQNNTQNNRIILDNNTQQQNNTLHLYMSYSTSTLRQQNNTLHFIVLINITENTRKALDDGNVIHLFSWDR